MAGTVASQAAAEGVHAFLPVVSWGWRGSNPLPCKVGPLLRGIHCAPRRWLLTSIVVLFRVWSWTRWVRALLGPRILALLRSRIWPLILARVWCLLDWLRWARVVMGRSFIWKHAQEVE